MINVGIVIGSTRPGRRAEAVAKWVLGIACKRTDAKFELVDLQSLDLPLLDEPVPPSLDKYSKPHTLAWAAKIAPFDAFIFVTPEYNHSTSGALKNAIDYLYKEWNDKAAALVGYGSAGGARAIEHLRGILSEVQVAHVRNTVMLSLFTDFENFAAFKPAPQQEKALGAMLDQLVPWAEAMKQVRAKKAA